MCPKFSSYVCVCVCVCSLLFSQEVSLILTSEIKTLLIYKMSFKNNKMIKINKPLFFFFLRLEDQIIVLIVTHKMSLRVSSGNYSEPLELFFI